VATGASEVNVPVTEAFRLLAVPGVTVNKWSRTWSERLPEVRLQLMPVEAGEAAATLLSAQADAGLVRLPVDMDVFHAISLYTEASVVVVEREHGLADLDEVTMADLAGETLLLPLDDVLALPELPGHRPASTAAAVELVAASAGLLIVPQSLARLHHRRDLTYRVVTDAPVSSVALVWMRDRQTELVEEMIGIVRGRTANSTRGPSPAPADAPARKPAEGGAGRRKPASGQSGTRRGGPNPRTSPQRRGR
jgi:DNA-binding transcriptional LysR family regulator